MVLRFAKAGGWKWPGDLRLLYDFETDNGQPLDKCARHIMQFIGAYRSSEDHYPGIYTTPGFWELVLCPRGVVDAPPGWPCAACRSPRESTCSRFAREARQKAARTSR